MFNNEIELSWVILVWELFEYWLADFLTALGEYYGWVEVGSLIFMGLINIFGIPGNLVTLLVFYGFTNYLLNG